MHRIIGSPLPHEMKPYNVPDDQKSLLPTNQAAQQSLCSFMRIVRVNCSLIIIFVLMYYISYLRVADLPKTPTRSSPLAHETMIVTTKLPVQLNIPTVTPSSNEYNQVEIVESTTSQTVSSKITINLSPEIGSAIIQLPQNESDIVCKIPELDPFDKSIKKYIKDETNAPKCHTKYPLVFKLGLNSSVIRLENTTEWTNCCYKVISRTTNGSRNVDNEVIFSKKCFPMSAPVTNIPPEHEFIGIYCDIPETQRKALNVSSSSNQLVDAFAFVHQRKVNRTSNETDSILDSEDKVNLVVFGIDGVSHMNFLRIMPKVEKYLTQNLSAISMNGYVKVGDNTFPNLLAVMTFMKIEEANNSCENNKFFDDCPLLWKNSSAQGYRTSYAEDAPFIGTFNYLKNGFRLPPTDYYLRPLSVVLDKQLGSDSRGNCDICFGPRLAIEVLLNYMQKLAVTMEQENQRYFQFTWTTSLTHDYLNQGKLGEKATLETLQWFHEENHLNQTVLVFMSDHGIRYGDFRKTRQGKIEENLPFLYFVFPLWFQKKYSLAISNLMKNKNRLTSPFDLHETFLDIMNTTSLEKSVVRQREEMLNSQRLKGNIPRGISMFLPSPLERTCAMAEIPEHYCACHETEDLKPESSLAQQASNFAVFHLNSLVSNYIQCAYLSLKKVTNAFMFYLEPKLNVLTVEQVIKVSFVTSPGDAEFDGTLVRVVRVNETEKWTLSDISRVNLYGNQSHCVTDKIMKKYCYCTDFLKR